SPRPRPRTRWRRPGSVKPKRNAPRRHHSRAASQAADAEADSLGPLMGRAIFATVLSLVLPGLGHFFLGLRRGVWFAVPSVVLLYLYWASLWEFADVVFVSLGSSPPLTPSRSSGAGMASSEDKTRGLLIAYDTIAAPGQRVTLVAELLEDGLLTHPPLG